MKYWFRGFVFIVCSVQLQNAQTVSYSANVRPLFNSYGCLDCHGGSGNLFLDTYESVFSTGDHKPVVVAGDTNSIIVLKLKGIAGFGARMPKGGDPISPADLNTIIAWILNGAPENSTSIDRLNDPPFLKTFELKQNYPNPFNPSTTIQFSVPTAGNVALTLFDAVGKLRSVLLNRPMETGTYAYTFNAGDLPSGVYFYRLQTAGHSSTKKLVLTK